MSEYWTDEYDKKKPEELTSYATYVDDWGYAWRVARSGRTYCAGKSENLKKEVK